MDRATNYEDVRRVLIAGDTHGNTRWVKHLTEVAARNDCPVIIQVGDFGYFPDHRDGPRFISSVDQACATNGVELWFIDGNHDDHTSLAELEHGHIPVAVAEHVTYLPRGTRLHLGGLTFGFLGGAFSVDWRDRTAGIDWWHHEVTDTDDVARLGTERLDVLIAHDAPAGVVLTEDFNQPLLYANLAATSRLQHDIESAHAYARLGLAQTSDANHSTAYLWGFEGGVPTLMADVSLHDYLRFVLSWE